jgi:HEAT repeat protein
MPAPAAPVAPLVAAIEDQALHLLTSPKDRDRIDAALLLGRNRVEKAIDPLQKVLANDQNPRVLEAAVRGLGLIATPACLKPLETAAQSDEDPEVRRSARFAAQVIRANTR